MQHPFPRSCHWARGDDKIRRASFRRGAPKPHMRTTRLLIQVHVMHTQAPNPSVRQQQPAAGGTQCMHHRHRWLLCFPKGNTTKLATNVHVWGDFANQDHFLGTRKPPKIERVSLVLLCFPKGNTSKLAENAEMLCGFAS